MPGKAAIQAAFGRRRVWTRKGPFSCPSVAMSVRTRPMFAIPFAVNLGSVAVISRRCGILGCNERAHGPPMFAIPTPDVCRSLQLQLPPLGGSTAVALQGVSRRLLDNIGHPVCFAQAPAQELPDGNRNVLQPGEWQKHARLQPRSWRAIQDGVRARAQAAGSHDRAVMAPRLGAEGKVVEIKRANRL